MSSTIHVTFPRVALLAVAALLLIGFGGDPRPAAATGAIRVYYLFTPSSPGQLQRLQHLQASARGAEELKVTGLSRTMPVPAGIDAIPVERVLDATARERSHPSPAARRWLAARLQETGDALRVEGPTGTLASDAEVSVEMTALRAGLIFSTRTDIGFSTWGKVKDLFR